MLSFYFCDMFRPFVSAIIGYSRNNINGKYTAVDACLPFTVKTLKIHKLTVIADRKYDQCGK
jgi:hypothetical protein